MLTEGTKLLTLVYPDDTEVPGSGTWCRDMRVVMVDYGDTKVPWALATLKDGTRWLHNLSLVSCVRLEPEEQTA